jgi:hypothetical protein
MADLALQTLADREAITNAIVGYGAAIDRLDFDGLEALFIADGRARLGDHDSVIGASAIRRWIEQHNGSVAFGQHLISLTSITIDGDSAVTVANLHATQVVKSVPNASITIGRYRNRLVRTSEGWKIADHVLEVGWRGTAEPR